VTAAASDVTINQNQYRESVFLKVSDRFKMLEIHNLIQIILQ